MNMSDLRIGTGLLYTINEWINWTHTHTKTLVTQRNQANK